MIPQLLGDYASASPSSFTAAADASAGDVVVIESRVGVVVNDVSAGKEGVALFGTDTLGVTMPKASGAIAKHVKVYYDEDGDPQGGTAGSGAVTTSASGNLYIGRAAASAASGDARIAVELTNE